MAVATDSTTAPARPLLPLRDARDRFVKSATGADFAAPEPRAELPPEPLLPDSVEAIRADLDALVALHGEAPLACHGDTPMVPHSGAPTPLALAGSDGSLHGGANPEPDTAATARALHLRRALERAAEHAADLLPVLGLPQLVQPELIRLDPEAAGAALDAAIAALDDLDGDVDREPYLAGFYSPLADPTGEGEPSEDDEDEGLSEPSLGAPERSPWVPHSSEWRRHFRDSDGSQTRWAAGAQHDGEAVNEDGDTLDENGEEDQSDHEPSIGWPNDFEAHRGLTGAGYDETEPDEDVEEDERDDDRTAEDSALRVWVFGPSRRRVAHV